jgi:DNA-directed RNA polymerase specialized sigma24 family protein
MVSQTRPTLQAYNQLVLQHQDEAFTLAYYMLGSQGDASRVVEAAFQQAYQDFSGPALVFRRAVLRLVASSCLARGKPDPAATPTGMPPGLAGLPSRARLALVLVDLLGMNYSEAAGMLEQPVGRFASQLAQARRKLASGD